MSYARVIPRDLFNDANLLKCYGQLSLWALNNTVPGLEVTYDSDTPHFDIAQNPDDGSTYLTNVHVTVHGLPLGVHRPVNSRDPWPLYVHAMGDDDTLDIQVFNDDGTPHADLLALVQEAGDQT